ncbi:MAG: hypothetical protein FWE74_06460 [Oscillospiraceae bacterium]|nr:hypothetical protein [Oscillospiraceae bacterium]
MEHNKIPEIIAMTIKTIIFVKDPMELADTIKLLGDNYEVLYEKSNEAIEEAVKRFVTGSGLPECHLHRFETTDWIGYHIFISGIKEC